jgi:hypothetical protein
MTPLDKKINLHFAGLVVRKDLTKTVKGNPEFAVQFSDWNTQPRLPDSTFEFHAAPEAKSVQAVVSSCGASP